MKQPEAARDLFKKALAQYPQSRLTEDSKFGLARADEDLHETDAAAAIYAELAENKADGTRAAQSLMNLATIRFRSGQIRRRVEIIPALIAGFSEEPARAARPSSTPVLASINWVNTGRRSSSSTGRPPTRSRRPTAGYWKGITFKALGDIAQATSVLKATYQADPQGPVAENPSFTGPIASCDRPITTLPKKLFLELVAKWPRGEFADDSLHFADNSLHFAAEAALLAGSLDEAEQLVERFEKEYPKSPLALHEEILQGRVLDAKAAALLKQSDGSGCRKESPAGEGASSYRPSGISKKSSPPASFRER